MISRRTVLTGAGAMSVLAAAGPTLAAADGPEDRARVLANVLAYFGGTPASNADPAVAAKIAGIERTARTRLAAMDAAGPGELFAGVGDLGTNDPNLAASYSHLSDIALATVAPRPGGSQPGLFGDTATQDRVLDGLQWLYDHHFADQASGYYGNWYHWEIGIPRSVSMILALLHDRVRATRPELIDRYIAALDGYLRNGVDGDVDLDSRFHTGANLADITTNRIVQGAVTGDDARIRKAVSDQLTVYATVDPYHLQHGVKDGYYADGSFIQHESVAYTGSYGRTLLSRATQTIALLAGTGFAGPSDLLGTITGWVTDGFAPLIFEGWMMEIVKGRAVSRTATGYSDVTAVVEAAVALSGQLAGDDAAALTAYVKHLATASAAPPQPSALTAPANIVRYAAILADDTIAPADLNAAARTVAYNAMDRHVHRRPGYAFALARSSDRISKYEYMNGENLRPWFQAEGAFQLYLAGQDQTASHGVSYYATVSPYRLAGVTAPVEERRTIPELYGRNWYENPSHPLNFTSSSVSQNTYVYFPRGTNTWSGGATLDAYGVAGMVRSDDVAYRDQQAGILPADFVAYRNARSTTSWIMLDDEIVVLTAGVSDPDGRAVTTTLDARIARPTDTVAVTGELADGTPWSGTGTSAELSWLRYANAIAGTAVGYVLLAPAQVEVAHRRVTSSLRSVRLTNPNTSVTTQVFDATVTHPADATHPGSTAYAIVPLASVEALRGYRTSPPVDVLANTATVQAVRHHDLRLTAVNTFADGRHRVAEVTVDGPASVIMRRTGRGADLAVSDPTHRRDSVTVTLNVPNARIADADAGITVRHQPGRTIVTANTHHGYGRTLSVRLRR